MKKIIVSIIAILLMASMAFAKPVYQTVIAYDVSNNPIYIGTAATGTSTAVAGWQIMKLTYTGTNCTNIQYADGDNNADNIYDNRAALTYL